MHPMNPRISELASTLPERPPLESLRLRSAYDVARWASINPSIGRITWPEVWHLDGRGGIRCAHRGSSLDSVRAWADDPASLSCSRTDETELLPGCPDRWVMVDSRPSWRHPPPAVDEADIDAFERLDLALAGIDVVLLDIVIFDDDDHWWSIHHATTGTTTWLAASRPALIPPRGR